MLSLVAFKYFVYVSSSPVQIQQKRKELMGEVASLYELFRRRVRSFSDLLSFRILAVLVLIELAYCGAMDFGAGYWEGVMQVMGS